METVLGIAKKSIVAIIAGLVILGIYRLLGLDTRIEIFSYNLCLNFFELFILLLLPITFSKVTGITNPFEFLFDTIVCAVVSLGTIFVHDKYFGILIFAGNLTFKGYLCYLCIPFAIAFAASIVLNSKLAKS